MHRFLNFNQAPKREFSFADVTAARDRFYAVLDKIDITIDASQGDERHKRDRKSSALYLRQSIDGVWRLLEGSGIYVPSGESREEIVAALRSATQQNIKQGDHVLIAAEVLQSLIDDAQLPELEETRKLTDELTSVGSSLTEAIINCRFDAPAPIARPANR